MNDEIEKIFCALIAQRPHRRAEHLMAEAHEIFCKGRRTRERIARIAAARQRYEEWAAGKPDPMPFPEALPQIVTGLQEFRPALAKKNLKTLLQFILPFYRRQEDFKQPENPERLIEHWQGNKMPLFDVYFLTNCYRKYWPEIISEQNRANARKGKREKKGPPEKQRVIAAQFVTEGSDKLRASKRDFVRALTDVNEELEQRESEPPN